MDMKRILATTLLLAGLTSPVQAQYLDGNKLLSLLNSTSETKRAIAAGYITGVVDAHSDELCVPQGVSIQQLNDVVHEVLKRIPSHRHKAADVLIYAAVRAAYGCGSAS